MAQTLTNLNINDNNAVISALREGDEEVFDHIYRYYFRGLCAFCSQYVTLSESEEIVQDTMMWLWGKQKNPYTGTYFKDSSLYYRQEQSA